MPVDECATLLHLSEKFEPALQNSVLGRDIARSAKIISHWEIHKQAARWLNLSRQVSPRRVTDGSNTRLFYDSAYQTNGLVVKRSGRCGE